MSKFAQTSLFLSLIFLLAIVLVLCHTMGEHPLSRSGSNIDALVIDYLSRKYEQPEYGWEDYKSYFLPDDPGLNLLSDGTDLGGLRVYRASVWMLHWVPEEFPILVWAVSRRGDLQMGVLEEPEQIKTMFPAALKGITFEGPGPRKNLALLLGEMVTVFESDRWRGGVWR